MIIRGGENIYPREIESVLLDHPGVAEVAVVGVPDANWGEQVAAAFVPRDGRARRRGRAGRATAARTSRRYKAPRLWVFVDDFPLTPSGKVNKRRLGEELAVRCTTSV